MSALYAVRLENVSGRGDLSDPSSRHHWEAVWERADPDRVSWYETHPGASLRLIESAGVKLDAAIIDVGGGASVLVRELLTVGYTDLTVLEISERGIQAGLQRLGPDARTVDWIHADVRDFNPARSWDLWHDRAVFHFLTGAADRGAYRDTLESALSSDGQAVIATFGPEGPTTCSGLQVCRYGPESLSAELGPDFVLAESCLERHVTPAGAEQQFLYARFSRS